MTKTKNFQLNKSTATLFVTVGATFAALFAFLFFEPGAISPPPSEEHHRKASMPEIPKTYGPTTDIAKPSKNRDVPRTFEMPFQQPDMSSFLSRIPTELPKMEIPSMRPPDMAPTPPPVNEKALSVYARHAEMLKNMQAGLSKSFEADKIASAPRGNESKFSSAYVLLKDGESMERLDLMSLVRNDSMRSIKTAKDALNALVEESSEVNVIEQTDEYLIYDISGTRGYQVGKISVDDDGVHISGYVNLTTKKMPDVIRKTWIDKLKKA